MEKRLSILGYPVEPFTARKVECPCRKCSLQIQVDEVLQHMKTRHGKTTVFAPVDEPRLSCRYAVNVGRVDGPHNSFANCWSYDGRRFIARFQQLYPTWFAWVYVLDGHQAADGYYCNIEAVAAEEREGGVPLRTSYTGPLHAIDSPKREIRNNTAQCLQLTDQTIRMYCDPDLVTDEERETGYNAVVRLVFTVCKKDDLAKEDNRIAPRMRRPSSSGGSEDMSSV